MTKRQAIKTLREADHAILGAAEALPIAEAFGVDPPRIGRFKPGVGRVESGPNGADAFDGIGAHTLAEHICDQLGLPLIGLYGIGSRLHYAVDQIESATLPR